jgi:hypothetical protein
MSAIPPVYTPPVFTIPATLAVGSSPLTGATTGNIPVLDYSPILASIAVSLAEISYELKLINFNQTVTSIPGTPASINQVAASAMNDIADVMSSMLTNQNEMTSAITRIQLALAGVAGAVGEGVATNQILASSTIKKHQKETAETEAAITASGREPTTQSRVDFQTKITETLNEASDIAIQAKASGFVSNSISNAVERTYNFASDQVSAVGTAASNFIKDTWPELVKTKVQKPEDTSKSAQVAVKAQSNKAKLGL